MSEHVLIKQANPEDLKIAREAADWLRDAVACEVNELLIAAIERNGVLACLRAMKAKARGEELPR